MGWSTINSSEFLLIIATHGWFQLTNKTASRQSSTVNYFISGGQAVRQGGNGETLTIWQKTRTLGKNGNKTPLRNVTGSNPLPDIPVGKGKLFGWRFLFCGWWLRYAMGMLLLCVLVVAMMGLTNKIEGLTSKILVI